ncbi:MAG: TRADD-N-associated membrane domain-containing protein [Anaerolineae bacterium]
MAKATILFADNDSDFLKTRSEFLEQEGYLVIPAADPTEARRKLEVGRIDLVIVDIRLVNDDDEKDTSGLTLAKEVARTVPKIILTGFPSYEYVRDALRPQLDGLPAAVDFVAKQEGPEALLRTVRKALGFAPEWLRKTIDGTAKRLDKDYEDACRQSQMNYIASLVVAGIGIVIIFIGTVFAIRGVLAFGIASAVGGIVTEAVTYLFFRRVDLANTRMDRYHAESLQIKQFENLLAACEELPSPEQREACKERIIDTVRAYWFEPNSSREEQSHPSTSS